MQQTVHHSMNCRYKLSPTGGGSVGEFQAYSMYSVSEWLALYVDGLSRMPMSPLAVRCRLLVSLSQPLRITLEQIPCA